MTGADDVANSRDHCAGQHGQRGRRRLAEHEVVVTTLLEGRGEASRTRARDAGMVAVGIDELVAADWILSIVPPGEALPLAKNSRPSLPTPSTTGLRRLQCGEPADGGPDCRRHRRSWLSVRRRRNHWWTAKAGQPWPGHLCLGARRLAFRRSVAIRPRRPRSRRTERCRVGAENVLRRDHQRFTALGAMMMLAATRGGTADALKAELGKSQPALLAWLTRQMPAMHAKAYRWVAEMEEISEFVGDDAAARALFESAARLYERIATDFSGEQEEIGALSAFVAQATPQAREVEARRNVG